MNTATKAEIYLAYWCLGVGVVNLINKRFIFSFIDFAVMLLCLFFAYNLSKENK